MAVHTVTAKDINALAGRDYPEAGRGSDLLRGCSRGSRRGSPRRRYRATLTELSDLTDRQLADIGILRADIAGQGRRALRPVMWLMTAGLTGGVENTSPVELRPHLVAESVAPGSRLTPGPARVRWAHRDEPPGLAWHIPSPPTDLVHRRHSSAAVPPRSTLLAFWPAPPHQFPQHAGDRRCFQRAARRYAQVHLAQLRHEGVPHRRARPPPAARARTPSSSLTGRCLRPQAPICAKIGTSSIACLGEAVDRLLLVGRIVGPGQHAPRSTSRLQPVGQDVRGDPLLRSRSSSRKWRLPPNIMSRRTSRLHRSPNISSVRLMGSPIDDRLSSIRF